MAERLGGLGGYRVGCRGPVGVDPFLVRRALWGEDVARVAALHGGEGSAVGVAGVGVEKLSRIVSAAAPGAMEAEEQGQALAVAGRWRSEEAIEEFAAGGVRVIERR